MRYTYRVLLLLLMIAQFQFSFAQLKHAIIGNVTDDKTGETLIGASVKLTGSSTAIAMTNSYGFYAVSAPGGDYDISVSFIGYKTITRHLVLSKDMHLDFSLESGNQLNEVIVSGDKSDENVSSPQMGMQKMKTIEINNLPMLLGERDVMKALQLLPGIKLAGEGNSGFYIRGGAADQNLILLDEAPVYNASHLLGFFSTFNSDAIKDVTVYKEGMPAQYGGRLAAVLDIKMNDGNRKKNTIEGGIGLISSRLKVEGPIVKDKGSFMISARRTYLDAFFKLSPNPSINKNTLYFYDLNAKANYRLDEKNTLFLSGYFGRDKLNLVKIFGFDWGNRTLTLRWNHLYSNRLFSNTSLIYSHYNYVIHNFMDDSNFEVNSSIRDFNLKQDFEYNISNKHKLKFGINGIHHTIAPGKMTATGSSSVNNVTYENRRGLELAAYVMDEWTAGEKLSFVYGLRLSSFSLLGPGNFKNYDHEGNITKITPYSSGEFVKSYVNPEPRFSANYRLNLNSAFKASYTRNTQNIHLMSNSTSTSPTDLYIMNSNNVKPEIADQVSAGYFRNFSEDQYELSAEVYYKWMQNQIEYRNGTDLREKDNVEADLLYGDGRAYGIELFLKKRFGKFNGWVGYTYSRTERQFDGLNGGKWFYAKQDRTHDISLVGIYKPGPRWTFSAVFVYNTGNAVTYPSGKYQINGKTVFYYTEKNAYRTPAYHRLDVSATLAGKPGRRFQSSWSFGIYNLYNRQNAFAINFKDDPDDASKTQVVRTTLFGIIPSATWNFKF
ncbi:collagen-binding protein [Pedobacter lusitanus]|uniref:Collagen-binding protein n=1 Tax=Pedobacter lusitanus TaxID=1503925 RepID=A0A0D0GJV6_9SPHI|nr:TonB-dependent receptor [Pedobacter lusitanus]KIO77552.1 collagen-binding protein [Pedobacter lusitanus]